MNGPYRGSGRSGWTTISCALALGILVLAAPAALPAAAVAAEQRGDSVPAWFRESLEHLTRDGGRWITDNAAYRSDAEPFPFYGTEFSRGLSGRTAQGRLFGILPNGDETNFWEFYIHWDPLSHRAIMMQTHRSGAFGTGELTRPEPGVEELDQRFWWPDGSTTRSLHRERISPDERQSQSFQFQDTAWAPRRSYLWKRSGRSWVTTDDSVRLYYKIVGEGEGSETVVVPMAAYLEELLAPLARPGRRMVFYDPRHRGRSGRGDLSRVSLDRQVADLEQLRQALGLERMALVGWSGLGMEMAVYAIRHPDRVTRLVQVAPVPPSARIMRDAGGDRRSQRTDTLAVAALDRRFDAGEFAADPAGFCRARARLTLPANFVDTSLAHRVPDVCRWENEWPVNLWPYFGALLGSFGDYDWLDQLAALEIPRLVIHGRQDEIPLVGARAWAAGFPTARLLVLAPAGHFPFVEQPDAFFAAVDRFLAGEWPLEASIVPGSARPPGGD